MHFKRDRSHVGNGSENPKTGNTHLFVAHVLHSMGVGAVSCQQRVTEGHVEWFNDEGSSAQFRF